jgi:gluconolactonase
MKKRTIIFLFALSAMAFFATAGSTQDWSFVARLNPALDEIVPADAKVEKLADSFGFLEGPVWVRKGGYLLFSDIPANVIYKWSPEAGKVSTFLSYSGFTGADSNVGMQLNNGRALVTLLGSNGITLDAQGRVVYCAHGDHQVVRVEADGRRTVLASEFEGKRLNSPNDLVYKSDGSLYFTDPIAGFRDGDKDPKKELPFTGIYMLKNGKLQLIERDLRPNGIAFSPDEKYVYLVDGTDGKKTLRRYEVQPDGTFANGQLFIDMTPDKAPGNPDGIKVDQKGNVYSTGPGGVWIMAPDGKHLGTILTLELPANLAFGDTDNKTLFLTARTGLYRIRLKIPGILPPGNS